MSSYYNLGKKLISGIGQAINKTKTNVPKTEKQKKIRDLKIATQKLKGSKAKLDQSIFEMKTGQPITFKKSTKKSESNKEAYKRIQNENSKVLKSMLDKATEKKADGGRIGLKSGTSKKKKKLNQDDLGKKFDERFKKLALSKEAQFHAKDYDEGLNRAERRAANEIAQEAGLPLLNKGGRVGRKFWSKPKTNIQKIKETFAPKKSGNVPSKFKGFSKLPEAVQQKMNKKLAKKV